MKPYQSRPQNNLPAQRNLCILVHEDSVLTAISGPLDVLHGTNQYLEQQGKPPAFHLELVSEKMKNIQLLLPAKFICSRTFSEVEETDLIIVPSFVGDPESVLNKNHVLVNWIKTMKEKGAEVASLCRGSYFLAEAGLLNGKPCTSHWQAVEDMQSRIPDCQVLPDRVITDQDGVYTSGGAFSSIHLILYLVEKFCGRETAIAISKHFSIDMDRVSQAHFAVFMGQRGHEDEEILNTQTFIEQNYNRPLTVSDIAARANMSRRNFIRRFKKATHNTPHEYLQRVKIEAAKKTLESSNEPIGIVMLEIGYSDPKTFRSVFKRYTGLTPKAYRNKYSRAAAAV